MRNLIVFNLMSLDGYVAGPGGNVFGSITLWNDLLAHGLVDELHMMVGAVVVGSGTPAFAGSLDAGLRLIGVRQLDGSQNVLMRYAVSHD
jgi:dihydrofolate reductase